MTSDIRVSVLTPPGTGAIATVAVSGPQAWTVARHHFRPVNGKALPEVPEQHRFWFGTLGDEVILAVKQVEPETHLEFHCHGGRRVVRWIVDRLVAPYGGEQPPRCNGGASDLLAHAPTLRTASILLDQLHGAFERTVRDILANPEHGAEPLARLARFAPLGRHLVAPWKVVIAGEPNVGKSSLVNALAGYQRTVVSEFAGTTRDVVAVPVAFDGWPVELADTAGMRDAAGLEAEGIERAERRIRSADLVVWVLDSTAPPRTEPATDHALFVINKCDLPAAWDTGRFPNALRVSAITGEGIVVLAASIVRQLIPCVPEPGEAVPYAPPFADAVETAHTAMSRGCAEEAVERLRAALKGT